MTERRPQSEEKFQHQERMLRYMSTLVGLAFELEANLANPDGMTSETTDELTRTRDEIHTELDEIWIEYEELGSLNNETKGE